MSKGKILVVDDEMYIVHILEFSLGAAGYDVLAALDGHQGLEKVRATQPDLIVLDVMMPRINGYEVCQILKSDATTKHIPVILLSAKGHPVERQIMKMVGAEEMITKPFAPRELVVLINQTLVKYRT